MTNQHDTAQTTATTDRRRAIVIFNLVARGLDGLMRLEAMQRNLRAKCRPDRVTGDAELEACLADQQQNIETVTAEMAGLLWAYFEQLGVDGVLAQALAERDAPRASNGGAA